jgi:anti-sigma factor RsiW
MKCEQIAELLPDYLQGNLNHEQTAAVEQHCQQCADCADDVAVWKKLSVLPNEQLGPQARARFEQMLDAHTMPAAAQTAGRSYTGAKPASGWSAVAQWLRSPLGAAAWSVALLLIGVFLGTRLGDVSSPRSREMAAMHSELDNMRQLVVLSMLTQQSAAERLQGVSWSSREEHLDPQVQAALLHTLHFDGSVDVRLAALDALSRHAQQPQVRKGVVDALGEQQSPLVQVALIDLLAEWRDPDAAQRLRNFEQTPNLNPAVRQRAEWAVSKLQ